MFHSSNQPSRGVTCVSTPRLVNTVRRSAAALVAIGLLLTFTPGLTAQDVYQPATTLLENQLAQQFNAYNPDSVAPQQQRSPVRLKTTGSIVDSVLPGTPQPASPRRDEWQRVLHSSSATGGQTRAGTSRPASFIDREKASGPTNRESAQALITKISINLGFVLALAVGFVLFARQWQKSKTTPQPSSDPAGDTLCIRQSLTLAAGASLHVVEGFQHKFLVAIDAAGIKSVKVLNPSFAETLEESETMPAATDGRAALRIFPEPRASEPVLPSQALPSQPIPIPSSTINRRPKSTRN